MKVHISSDATTIAAAIRTGQEFEALELNPDGSLVQLEAGSWFVCFVPAIDRQWWHRFVHKVHKHVFAIRPERDGSWTLFEPWWTRLLTATINTIQAEKFLLWGAQGDVLLVREAIPGHSSQLRGWITCAVLAAHLLGRRYHVWTPHQLYRQLLREPNVCRVDVSALLQRDSSQLGNPDSRIVEACAECGSGPHIAGPGTAKPFCMHCGRDLGLNVAHLSEYSTGKGRRKTPSAWRSRFRWAHAARNGTSRSDATENQDHQIGEKAP